MFTVHTRLHQELLHRGIAIDPSNTRVREDCFDIKRHRDGGLILHVMVAIPPLDRAKVGEIKRALLAKLKHTKTNFAPINTQGLKDVVSFCVGHTCRALVAEYVFSKEEELIGESLYTSVATLSHAFTLLECNNTPEIQECVRMIDRAFDKKEHLKRRYASNHLARLEAKEGPGSKLVFGALELFNHTCRTVARRERIPFLASPHPHGENNQYRLSAGYARFNRPFRDPCAFINLANMAQMINGGRPLISKQEIKELLVI